MKLEYATKSDIDPALKLVNDLSAWLKTKGIAQWSDSFPRATFETEQAKGELFVVREKEQVIASVALTLEPGEHWDDKEKAIYLHRLAVRRSHAGKAIGQAVMAMCEGQAKRSGYSRIRLVCDAQNFFLQSYYQSLGYERRGTKHHELYKMDFARFEKNF